MNNVLEGFREIDYQENIQEFMTMPAFRILYDVVYEESPSQFRVTERSLSTLSSFRNSDNTLNSLLTLP